MFLIPKFRPYPRNFQFRNFALVIQIYLIYNSVCKKKNAIAANVLSGTEVRYCNTNYLHSALAVFV